MKKLSSRPLSNATILIAFAQQASQDRLRIDQVERGLFSRLLQLGLSLLTAFPGRRGTAGAYGRPQRSDPASDGPCGGVCLDVHRTPPGTPASGPSVPAGPQEEGLRGGGLHQRAARPARRSRSWTNCNARSETGTGPGRATSTSGPRLTREIEDQVCVGRLSLFGQRAEERLRRDPQGQKTTICLDEGRRPCGVAGRSCCQQRGHPGPVPRGGVCGRQRTASIIPAEKRITGERREDTRTGLRPLACTRAGGWCPLASHCPGGRRPRWGAANWQTPPGSSANAPFSLGLMRAGGSASSAKKWQTPPARPGAGEGAAACHRPFPSLAHRGDELPCRGNTPRRARQRPGSWSNGCGSCWRGRWGM